MGAAPHVLLLRTLLIGAWEEGEKCLLSLGPPSPACPLAKLPGFMASRGSSDFPQMPPRSPDSFPCPCPTWAPGLSPCPVVRSARGAVSIRTMASAGRWAQQTGSYVLELQSGVLSLPHHEAPSVLI